MSIVLDTRQKNSGSNYNCTFQVKTHSNLVANAITLAEVIFVNGVSAFGSYSNKFIFNEGGADISVTIPAGYYSGTAIATKLGTLMTAATTVAAVYTVTYDTNTQKLSISTTVPDFTIKTGTNTCYDQLGFLTVPSTSSAGVLAATDIVRLDGPEYTDLEVDFHTGSSYYFSKSATNIIARIPLNASYGSYVHYLPNPPMILVLPQIDFSRASFALRFRDPDGNDFELPDHCNVSLRFTLS